MSLAGFLKPPQRQTLGLAIAALAVTGATGFYVVSQVSPPKPIERPTPVRLITALGRLEPETEVVQIAPPLTLEGDRLAELRVKDGDRVQAGQIIAILDSRQRLQAAVAQAAEQVQVAQARLAQVRSGAKAGEIQAQQAAIARLQAELQGESATRTADINRWQAEVRTARSEYDRFQQLYREGAIAASTLDSKRLALDTATAQLTQAQASLNRGANSLEAQLQEARATLSRIAEVRPVDVQTAQAEVQQAIAALNRAKTDLDQAFVRAPFSGQILTVHARPGEAIPSTGIADLGQTDRMRVVAEIYQTDIGSIQLGQTVRVTGQAFTGELTGTVSQIGLQISRQNVFSNEPGENLDRRVVEVKIRLNPADSKRVAGLTNLQVQVAIEP